MREKESGLLHHQLEVSLGARIALTFAHLSVSLSTDFCQSLYPCTPLASTNVFDLRHLRTDYPLQIWCVQILTT